MSSGVKWALYAAFTFIAACIFYIALNEIVKVVSRVKVSSFNLKSIGEIKLENKSDSLLNIYLDEIVYFFRQQRIDAVFFEDLDRFKGVDIQIFTKLRELNHLLNNAVSIDYTVNFIFALKDDMFHSNEERTKFFDFVIPVIPYVNKSNSANILKTSLYKIHPEFKKELDEEFIEKIAYFVGDMRTLINIQNEFSLYLNNLKGRLQENPELLNPAKLLGFMVYKNVYPQDFALLNKGKGIVINALNSKNELIREKVDQLKQEIKIKEDEITSFQAEKIDSIDELNLLTLVKIINLLNNGRVFSHVQTASKLLTIKDFLSDTDNAELHLSSSLQFTHRSQSGGVFSGAQSIDASHMQSLRNWFKNKKSIIESRNNIEKYKNEIVHVQTQILSVRRMTFGELLLNYPSLKSKVDKEVTDENYELLLYLLKNEYIDDNYNFYLTYHHDGGLTLNDMKFVHDVKNQVASDYLYPLNNPKKVADKLGDRFLSTQSALNVNLVSHLVSIQENDWQKKTPLYYLLVSYIENDEQSLCEFLIQFLHVSPAADLLIHFLVINWDEFWDFITYEAFDDEHKNQIFDHLIKNTPITHITKLDQNENLSKFLKEKDILQFAKKIKGIEKFHALLNDLGVRFNFENLKSVTHDNKDFRRFVINELYEITEETIDLILKNYCEFDSLNGYKNNHLSTILNSGCDGFASYIKNNLDEYFDNVYSGLEEQEESSEFISKVLAFPEKILSDRNKEKFLLHQKSKLKDLSGISENWYEFLFENDLIEALWINVVAAYKVDNEISSALLEFLNEIENSKGLSKEELKPEIDDEPIIESLSASLIKSNELSDECYEYLVRSISYWYRNVDMSSLNNAKVKSLIQHRKIRYTDENMDNINEYHPSLKTFLIKADFDNFLENYDLENLTDDDILEILESNDLSIDQKASLINAERDRVKDSLQIFKEFLLEFCTSYKSNMRIDFEIISSIFNAPIRVAQKVSMLNNQISHLSDRELIDLVSKIGGNYRRVIKNDAGMQYFNETDDNKFLFDELNNRKLVGKVTIFNENVKVASKKIRL